MATDEDLLKLGKVVGHTENGVLVVPNPKDWVALEPPKGLWTAPRRVVLAVRSFFGQGETHNFLEGDLLGHKQDLRMGLPEGWLFCMDGFSIVPTKANLHDAIDKVRLAATVEFNFAASRLAAWSAETAVACSREGAERAAHKPLVSTLLARRNGERHVPGAPLLPVELVQFEKFSIDLKKDPNMPHGRLDVTTFLFGVLQTFLPEA